MTEGPPNVRPTPAQARAKHTEIARRYGRRYATKGERIIAVRCGEMRRILRSRHGTTLPNDIDSRLILQILFKLGMRKAGGLAPWLDDDEAAQLQTRRVNVSPDAISKTLALTDAERAALHVKTIPPCDVAKRDRKRRAKDRHRERERARAAAKRAARNAVPRSVYLARSLSQTQPWQAEGVSRRTWYRRRKVFQVAQDCCERSF